MSNVNFSKVDNLAGQLNKLNVGTLSVANVDDSFSSALYGSKIVSVDNAPSQITTVFTPATLQGGLKRAYGSAQVFQTNYSATLGTEALVVTIPFGSAQATYGDFTFTFSHAYTMASELKTYRVRATFGVLTPGGRALEIDESPAGLAASAFSGSDLVVTFDMSGALLDTGTGSAIPLTMYVDAKGNFEGPITVNATTSV